MTHTPTRIYKASSMTTMPSISSVLCWLVVAVATIQSIHGLSMKTRNSRFDYDLVVIGAGASGLFASGTAASLGLKTLVLEKSRIGGDCTNSACVPSKAIRSVAKLAEAQRRGSAANNGVATIIRSSESNKSRNWLGLAKTHASHTVMEVRKREDVSSIVDHNPNLDLSFCQECKFVNRHEVEILAWNETSPRLIKSKSFLIATGASPIVPKQLEEDAKSANVPLYTYRSLLEPEGDLTIWEMMNQTSISKPNIVLVGGGATACELGQTLARLADDWNVTIVAPSILSREDAMLQNAALKLLNGDRINILQGLRVTNIRNSSPRATVVLSDDTEIPVDALVVCAGRSPGASLEALNLEAAGVNWSTDEGVIVKRSTLQSKTSSNIYACGDCASVVSGDDRRAAHGAWTGFHVARNLAIPWILRAGSQSTHPFVPRVTYTDPEMASVGMSHSECVKRFGSSGFVSISAPEEGMDRADMERLERPTFGFVELRATKIGGHILGMTACGPAAAELANEIGVALQNKLTVRDIAKSMHSYPSHGYLLHRIALAMAMGGTLGALDVLGPGGRLVAVLGRLAWRSSDAVASVSPFRRRRMRKLRKWEYEGSSQSIATDDGVVTSFLAIHLNSTRNNHTVLFNDDTKDARYHEWAKRRPH